MKEFKEKVKKEINTKITSFGTVWNNKRRFPSIARRTFLNA
jgi:hypothetical protein